MRRIASAIFLIALLAALAGCGQKGPLVRPNNGPASGHSAPPPAPTLPVPLPSDDGIG